MSKRILYVEDNPNNVLLVQRILNAEGHQLLVARDAAAGWQTAVTHQPDLILMDLHLPGELNGMELTQRLKQEPTLQHIPIVALTAHDSAEVKRPLWPQAVLASCTNHVFNDLPYPLLTLHLGNQSPVYSSITYNLMNFGEFVCDRYASIQYRQYLEGFLLNRIPLLNKLKWRLLATSNVIIGGMRQSNRDLIAQFSPTGAETLTAGYFKNNKPYVELGYGVENIFKFLRVDFIHRVSYLENKDARKFGILFSAQFQL